VIDAAHWTKSVEEDDAEGDRMRKDSITSQPGSSSDQPFLGHGEALFL
jgi:hypothetical protein